MNSPIFQRIHVSQLKVDPTVQRGLDSRRVAKLAAEFNVASVGAIVVSQRADGYYIIDGQHRHAAGLAAGFSGKLSCVVHQDLRLEDEAALFRTLNDSSKVQAVDKFRVRVVEGDKTAVVINNILARYGWQVAQSTSPGNLSAVAALEKVWDGAGVSRGSNQDFLVQSVMYTITKAWGHEAAGAHASLIAGIGQLFARFGAENLDLDRLTDVLSKVRPVDITSRAKLLRESQGGLIGAAVAKIIVGQYNKSLRTNRLPDWQWTR